MVGRWLSAAATGLTLGLGACGGGGGSSTDGRSVASATAASAPLSDAARLGELIFRDTSLSASGRQACISCHDPAAAHGAPNTLPAQFGGPALDRQGSRNTPSIRYLASAPAFGVDADGTPRGGLFWDGRARGLKDQAGQPFLNAAEMANASVAEVVQRLSLATYAEAFRRVYGSDILNRPDDAFARMTLALQQYQREDSAFHPFSSPYDDFLRGKTMLGAAALRGLAVYNDPARGNCAACHPSARGSDGSFPLFTDFSYDAIGVPRNPALARNADPADFDLGLCMRTGGDLLPRRALCGAFKVPTLRNVARRGSLFHNGAFGSLREALRFYASRDTDPGRWYPRLADGSVDRFNDLPPALRANVNTTEVPLNRRQGDAPALTEAEIDDLLAFLDSLTDADQR